MNISEQSYRFACENPAFRQRFLDNIDLAEVTPYIRDVKYDPREKSASEFLMRIHPPLRITYLKVSGLKSKVSVSASAFYKGGCIETANDFYAILVDHEGFHAKEYFETPEIAYPYSFFEVLWNDVIGKFNGEIEISSELRALENELKNADLRGVSNKHLEGIHTFLENPETCLS